MTRFDTLSGEAPLVIGHRGASAYLPEHTLEAYRLAIQLGANVIEPDVVPTKDGHLIARHENELSGTTDVADRPEFADRHTTKIIDGTPFTGWFSEDFTLAEIKTLNAKERIPDIRPGNTAYEGQFRVPTLEEVVALVRDEEVRTGRQIAIIPETKHPVFFEYEGQFVDGGRIGMDTSQMLVDSLVALGFTDPDRVYIQSFELTNLIELQTRIMPTADVDLPLIQLLGGSYDIAFNLDPANAALGGDVNAYAALNYPLRLASASPNSTDLATPAALQAMAALYAEGIGPFKDYILPTVTVSPPVDGNSDGRAQIARQLTGEVTQLVNDAHAAGLEVYPYTLRDEEAFQALRPDGTVRPPEEEYRQLIELGVDGFFTDSPDTGRVLVNILSNEPAPREPLDLEFLGQAVTPYGTSFGGLPIGGLSALTYDAASDAYLALSDDRSSQARFFTVRLDLPDGALSTGDQRFTGVQILADQDGRPVANNSIDPEGLAIAEDGSLYLSSEGDANALIAPFIGTFSAYGAQTSSLPVSSDYLPTADQSSGIRNNLAFEALTLSPDGKRLFVGTENALYQDGPMADVYTGSPSRVVEYDIATGGQVAEYTYRTEPVQDAPSPAGSFATNGLVELLAIDDQGTLLALERSFSTGVQGNDIRLFLARPDPNGADVTGRVPLRKELVLDFDELGIVLDNVEGMTFGPSLPDGRQTLVLVSDDNFSETQVTQFLAFALNGGTVFD
jgi:glycerophosphoryl diester phosphodiesterase